MKQPDYQQLLIDQNKDLIWIVNKDFELVYANKTYFNFMKAATGIEKKLNESALIEVFGEKDIQKWKSYYNRALNGEYFEIDEHKSNLNSTKISYSQITFEPLTQDDQTIFAVACQSKDITHLVKERLEKNQLIDASLDVFCIVNEQGYFMYVSDASINHWGYTPEELIGKSFKDIILEEDLVKTNETITSLHNGQEIKSFYNRYRKKNGDIAYNLWSARWDENTRLRYAVARDYKEKIEEEEIAHKSEQRFKALVQEGSDLVGILDADANYTYVSPTSISILGMAPEEFIGKSPFDFIHPDDKERIFDCLQSISTENKVIIEPFRFQNHKKEWRWLETVLTNLLDNPAVNGIVANSRDITVKIEEQHTLKLLESVITNTNDAILITEAEPQDEPGPKIIYVNEAFTKMTGYKAEEVIGKSPRILQGPNSNKEDLAKLGRSLRNWEPCELTTINYKKNGEEFWVNFTLTPVADKKGWYTHWIAIERDVTQQKIKELEKELLAQISINFRSENDLLNSVGGLCKSVSEFGSFDLVEIWISNIEKSRMQLLSHYVIDSQDETFYKNSPEIDSFRQSESLIGKVWTEGTQILWDDVEKNQNFVRRAAAKKIGLRAVLGVPLFFNGEVIGVLKIGSKNDAKFLKNYTQLFKQLEGYIGSELNRKKLENDFDHIFNALPDIICVLDLQGRFLKMNKAGFELMGFKEEAILYQKFEEFVHPQDKGIFTNEVMQLVKEHTTFNFENRYITKSGEIVWLSWNCNSTLQEGLIYAAAKNITEEKKLRELNRQVGSLAKIGSWEMDLVNRRLFWSDEIYQLHEIDSTFYTPSLEEAINFYREDFHQLVRFNVEKCISKNEPYDFEAVLITANNKELWVRTNGKAEFVDGVCKRIYGSFQDISSLKESENKLLSISENLPGIVFQYLIHPDGTDSARYVSGAVEKLFGYTASEVVNNINLVWDQIKAAGDYDEVKTSILKSVQTKSRWNSRIKYVLPTGELRTYLGNGTPTYLVDGTILYNSIILDITQDTKNEDLLTQASEMARIGSWEIDLLQNKTYWSDMVHSIMETDPEHYIPNRETNLNFFREDFHTIVTTQLKDSAEKGTPVDFEVVVVTANKNEKWVRMLGSAEVIDGKTNRIYGSFQDINERKQAGIQLLQSNERFEKVTEATNDAIWDWDIVNQTFYRSNAIERFFGKETSKSFVETGFWKDNFHPDDFRKIQKSVIKAISDTTCTHWELEYRIINSEKNILYVINRGIILRNKEGKAIRMVGAMTDISQRKKSDEENKFKAHLLNTIGQAAIATDLLGVVNYWNKAAENIYGWKSEEALGKNIIDLTSPESNKDQAFRIMESLKNGQSWSGTFNVRHKDGTTFPAMIINSPVLDENMILSGIIGISSDITKETKTEELIKQYTLELERSNEELEQFAFVASHDLQEPLRMISSFMDQLKRKYENQLDEKALKYIYFATDGAKRMKQIILDLLNYSRAGKLDEGLVSIDLNEILEDYKILRRKIIEEKNVTIINDQLPTVNCFKAPLIQTIHCLIDNAIKYSREGINPKIEIRVSENENNWIFSIKDNGIGIDKHFFDKIFIIFQRLHDKDQYGGTGIGLSIAKKNIEAFNGKIWLESELNKGSTFYFTINKIKL